MEGGWAPAEELMPFVLPPGTLEGSCLGSEGASLVLGELKDEEEQGGSTSDKDGDEAQQLCASFRTSRL